MAAGSLLALIDDIASILDDVAVMGKVAAKKTAGVLGDDLALNAQQVSGVNADRELPVVWAVAKGSLKNKAILVPAALAIGAFAPWAVTPLLMLGGAYLCFEGFEKLAHKYMHKPEEVAVQRAQLTRAVTDPAVDIVAQEKDKIKGAITTDFILSAEIIVIALGTVADAPFVQQVTVVAGIALIMTVGVYGLVAGIVKLDDAGLYLSQRSGAVTQAIGRALLTGAPLLMKTLSVVGTAAMFMVGGSIIGHGVPALHHFSENAALAAGGVNSIGPVLAMITPTLIDAVIGVITGAVVLLGVTLVKKVLPSKKMAH
jgi:predicted DNA repair protein MutK